MEKYCRARQAKDDSIIWRLHFACCLPKTTNTASEYVTRITFTRQQCFRDHASILTFILNIACLLVNYTTQVLATQRFGTQRCLLQILLSHIIVVTSVFCTSIDLCCRLCKSSEGSHHRSAVHFFNDHLESLLQSLSYSLASYGVCCSLVFSYRSWHR